MGKYKEKEGHQEVLTQNNSTLLLIDHQLGLI
jgi:hypothetical protein